MENEWTNNKIRAHLWHLMAADAPLTTNTNTNNRNGDTNWHSILCCLMISGMRLHPENINSNFRTFFSLSRPLSSARQLCCCVIYFHCGRETASMPCPKRMVVCSRNTRKREMLCWGVMMVTAHAFLHPPTQHTHISRYIVWLEKRKVYVYKPKWVSRKPPRWNDAAYHQLLHKYARSFQAEYRIFIILIYGCIRFHFIFSHCRYFKRAFSSGTFTAHSFWSIMAYVVCCCLSVIHVLMQNRCFDDIDDSRE